MHASVAHNEAQTKELLQAVDRPELARSNAWLWLAIAAVLLLIANGVDNVPLAAWLAPVFLLRFVRSQRKRVGLPIAYAVLIAAFAFQFRGMVPIPGFRYYIFLVMYGLPLTVPYAVDRMLSRRLGGISATLVFPTVLATTEFFMSRGPYATWGSVAYSQYSNLALLQLLSITGLWGITFLIAWFASVSNWLWGEGLHSSPARSGAGLCIGTIAMVMLLGGVRMAVSPPSSQTVRIASISKRKVEPEPSAAASERFFSGKPTPEDFDVHTRWARAMNNDLLARAEREMQAGAKIVFWGETNALVFGEQSEWVTRGGALAEKYHAYLGMALGVWHVGKNPPAENKLVLIEPNGQVAWEYHKAHPVPGREAAMQIRGDGRLRVLDTPYGRLSAIICYDGDFPQLLMQAGALGTDVVLDPSNDWRAIDPWHTQMVSFRAIEQGVNLVRGTSRGLSAAFDYHGRPLAAMDHYQTADYAMICELPTRGVRTIYSRLGDWFPWLCVLVLFLLLGKAARSHGRLQD